MKEEKLLCIQCRPYVEINLSESSGLLVLLPGNTGLLFYCCIKFFLSILLDHSKHSGQQYKAVLGRATKKERENTNDEKKKKKMLIRRPTRLVEKGNSVVLQKHG